MPAAARPHLPSHNGYLEHCQQRSDLCTRTRRAFRRHLGDAASDEDFPDDEKRTATLATLVDRCARRRWEVGPLVGRGIVDAVALYRASGINVRVRKNPSQGRTVKEEG